MRKTLSEPVGAPLTTFTFSEQCKAPNNVSLLLHGAPFDRSGNKLPQLNIAFRSILSPYFTAPFPLWIPRTATATHDILWEQWKHITPTISYLNYHQGRQVARNDEEHKCSRVFLFWYVKNSGKKKNQDKHDGTMLLENCSPVFAASMRWWWMESFLLQQKLTLSQALGGNEFCMFWSPKIRTVLIVRGSVNFSAWESEHIISSLKSGNAQLTPSQLLIRNSKWNISNRQPCAAEYWWFCSSF